MTAPIQDHDAPEVFYVDDHKVACDGGEGALGHPIVWYEMGDDGVVECGYCDRRFILAGGPADDRAP
ncbi:MAG: zinc-finger domain-containing protein [Pseudomonadota bacterium]